MLSYYQLFMSLLSSDLSTQKDSSSEKSVHTSQHKNRKTSYSTDNATLQDQEQSSSNKPNQLTSYVLHSRSLGGFEVPEAAGGRAQVRGDNRKKTEKIGRRRKNILKPKSESESASSLILYGLSEEVAFMEQCFENFAHDWQDAVQEENGLSRRPRAKVILMGHSVGAYITMEIMRRRREKLKIAEKLCVGGTPRSSDEYDYNYDDGIDVIGGVLLFPTVVDIAKSPNGRTLTVSHFDCLPTSFSLPT